MKLIPPFGASPSSLTLLPQPPPSPSSLNLLLQLSHKNYLIIMGVFPACVSEQHASVWCPQRPEEDVEFHGSGVSGVCELLCGCWEMNTSPLEDQAVGFF